MSEGHGIWRSGFRAGVSTIFLAAAVLAYPVLFLLNLCAGDSTSGLCEALWLFLYYGRAAFVLLGGLAAAIAYVITRKRQFVFELVCAAILYVIFSLTVDWI